jgi:hypothetical protein
MSGVKHTITERSMSARITIVALHLVVFGLSYLYFPVEGTMAKMIEQTVENNQDLVKSYSGA